MTRKGLVFFYFVAYVIYMGACFNSSAQSLESVNSQVQIVQGMAVANAGRMAVIEERVGRNSEDIKNLASLVQDALGTIKIFTGVGMAIGAIGAIQVLTNLVSARRKPQ